MKYVITLLIVLLFFFSGCKRDSYPLVPASVRKTIDLSGRNNIEFLKAIVSYREPADSLQLRSLFYLLSGLPQHGYRTYLLHDSSGRLIDYNIRELPSYDSLKAYKQVLGGKYGAVEFRRHHLGKDVYKVESSFLRDHIQARYQAWQNNPWAAHYTFKDFTTFILPYRHHHGPLDDWHTIITDTVLPKPGVNTSDPLVAADSIISTVKSYLHWDARYIENPTDQGWGEMKRHRQGRTEDMAAMWVAALSSYGVAASVDYLPAPQEYAHETTYWVAARDHQGNRKLYYPFGDTLQRPSRFPKVFRRTFQTYNEALPDRGEFLQLKYHHLEDGKYRDVTDEYAETVTVTIQKEQFQPQPTFSRVFLNVKHRDEWIPVAWKYYLDRLIFTKIVAGYSYALTDRQGNILYQFAE
jgi:hypothetical protein